MLKKKILGLFVIGCTAIASFTNAFNWNTIYVGDTETTVNDYTQRPTANGNYNFVGDNTNGNFFRYGNGTKTVFFYYTDEGMTVYTNTNYGGCKEGIINKYYIDTYTGFTNYTREGSKNSNNDIMTYTQADIFNLGLQKGDFNAISYSTEEGNANFGNYGIVAICWRSLTKNISVCTYASAGGVGVQQCTPNSNTIKNQYNSGTNITAPSQIPTNYLKNAKRENNNSRDDDTGSGTGEETTGGAKPYCPPIRFEIDMYGYKYNTGLCYSNTEEISGGQVTTVTPISIFEAFPTYQNYVQAYNLITNNCHTSTVNTVEQCQTALQGIGKKPSEILLKLINSNIQEGVSLSKIYQYCHLQLDFTEEEKRNTSTCNLKEEGTYYATGVNSTTQSNPNPLQGMTDALKNSTDIIIPEDGTIFDSILPDGVITWKDVIFDFNFWEHLTKLIGKMIILFKVRPIQTGILPPLITSLLLLVILFKIYKK